MKKNNFLINKYTLSFLILLLCLVTDILLHKGMSRVIITGSFADNWDPQNLQSCNAQLDVKNKEWKKAVNTVSLIEDLPADAAGFEMDVYFDTITNYLKVYHDSASLSELNIEEILMQYQTKKMNASIWLDFKNLSAGNEIQSLKYIIGLRNKYGLLHKLIIESSSPQFLQSFCDSGFFTSYYVRFFNPYHLKEAELIAELDTISASLKKNPVAALSGYYFQYPVLKKYFPNYPILTWSDHTKFSLVSNYFNHSLLEDTHVKVVLFPR